jgi:hypothetical protein
VAQGILAIRVMRLRTSPRRSVDPATGTKVWFVEPQTIYGTMNWRKKSMLKADTKALRRVGVSWQWLWETGEMGTSSRRTQKLLSVLAALRATH